MAEPARKPQHEDDWSEPKRDFGVIQGGGESSSRSSGHLQSVPSGNAVYDDEPVQNGRHLRAVPDTSGDPELAEQEGVGANVTNPYARTEAKKAIEAKEKAALKAKTGEGDDEDSGGWKNSTQDDDKADQSRRKKLMTKARAKKAAVASGIGMGVAGLGIIGFSMFLPYKLTHFIKNIEKKVARLPANAVERRVEYHMKRWLINKTLRKGGHAVPDISNRYEFATNSFVKTMYVRWEGAKLDEMLERDMGVKLVAKTDPRVLGLGAERATNWQLIDLKNPNAPPKNLDAPEVRRVLKELGDKRLFQRSMITRIHINIIGKKHYGVPSKVRHFFKRKVPDPVEKWIDRYKTAKVELTKFLVKNTVGRVSKRYGLYMLCILEGGENCKKIRKGDPDSFAIKGRDGHVTTDENGNVTGDGATESNKAATNGLGPIDDEAADLVTPDGVIDKALGQRILAKVKEMGLKKILGSFVAGIGIIDTMSQIEKSVTDGALSTVIYDRTIQQYVSFAAPFLGIADQIRAGVDFNGEDPAAALSILEGGEKSLVYQVMVNNLKLGDRSHSRDCNNDGDTTDPDDQLPPGESACANQKALINPTAFTNTQAWKDFHTVMEAYRKTVGGVLSFFNSIVGKISEAFGVDEIHKLLFEKTGLSKLAMEGFQAIMNWIFGVGLTGLEVGPKALDAIIGGLQAMYSSFGGDIGAGRDDSIGGGYLSDEKVAQINKQLDREYREEWATESLFARLFSPENTNSLTTQATLAMPTSWSSFRTTAASALSPANIISSLTSLFSKRVGAQEMVPTNQNPLGILQFGYDPSHPVFTGGEDGTGMDPEELYNTYECDKPSSDRSANKTYSKPDGLPFPVLVNPDPCQLERVATEVGGAYVSDTYEDLVNAATTATATAPGQTNTPPPGQAPIGNTSNTPCAQGSTVAQETVTGYSGGQAYTIKTCYVNGIEINSVISGNIVRLVNDAAAQGMNIGGSGFRNMEDQEYFWMCYQTQSCNDGNPAARPGYSNHQMGLAIDMRCNGGSFGGSACYNWMQNVGSSYGMFVLADGSEPWHWSVDGG